MQIVFASQALAAWQLFNRFEQWNAAGKKLLVVNLDETCIRCFESHGKGNVFGRRGESSPPVVQRLAKKLRKKCLTYIAMICNDREIQPLLPQYVIGNESTFLKKDLKRLGDACGANVVLVRRAAPFHQSVASCASFGEGRNQVGLTRN